MFSGLTGLPELLLGNNALTELPAGVFSGLAALRDLKLHDNNLAALSPGVLSGLTALRDLKLPDNNLAALPAGVFSGLDNLRDLALAGNEFTADTSLPAGIFDDVLDTRADTGGLLDVDANGRTAQFVCSCADAGDIVDAAEDCLRITRADLAASGAPALAFLGSSGASFEPTGPTSGDAVPGIFTLDLSGGPVSGVSTASPDRAHAGARLRSIMCSLSLPGLGKGLQAERGAAVMGRAESGTRSAPVESGPPPRGTAPAEPGAPNALQSPLVMSTRSYQGKTPQVHPSAFVDETALLIGDVTIGANSSVWPMCVLRGDVMPIRIGARTNIQDGSVLHVTADSHFAPGGFALDVGDNVTAGHGVILHACTIQSDCLIGMGATVLDSAVVSTHAIVGANSLVPPGKHLEGGFLWLGSPVEKVRSLRTEELEFLVFSAAHYVELKNRHLQG